MPTVVSWKMSCSAGLSMKSFYNLGPWNTEVPKTEVVDFVTSADSDEKANNKASSLNLHTTAFSSFVLQIQVATYHPPQNSLIFL